MEINVSKCIGYCNGVKNAISIVKKTFNENGKQILMFHELVHNRETNNDLINNYHVKVIDENELIDKNSMVILSAHGSKISTINRLNNERILFVDAICPHLKQVHKHIIDDLNNGKSVLFLAKSGHPECEAILSLSNQIIFIDVNNISIPLGLKDVVFYSQSTLDIDLLQRTIDEIKKKYGEIKVRDTACGSTYLRQSLLLNEEDKYSKVLIVGSSDSSNTKALYAVAKKHFVSAQVFMVSNLNMVENISFSNNDNVYLTSGASTSIENVNEIKQFLYKLKKEF